MITKQVEDLEAWAYSLSTTNVLLFLLTLSLRVQSGGSSAATVELSPPASARPSLPLRAKRDRDDREPSERAPAWEACIVCL